MKDIQTVTGALDPSLLGFTLMHEHLLISREQPHHRSGMAAL